MRNIGINGARVDEWIFARYEQRWIFSTRRPSVLPPRFKDWANSERVGLRCDHPLKGVGVVTPDEVAVWVGLDLGKDKHFAVVLDDSGEELFVRGIGNDEADIDAVLDQAAKSWPVGLVIDQLSSITQLAIAVAARRCVPPRMSWVMSSARILRSCQGARAKGPVG